MRKVALTLSGFVSIAFSWSETCVVKSSSCEAETAQSKAVSYYQMCFRIACKGYKVAGVSGCLGWSFSYRLKGRLYYAFGAKVDPPVPIGEKSRPATHN